MKKNKLGFFKRIKNAVFDFDKYKIFADEKLSTSIRYILKLMFIFSIVITILLITILIITISKEKQDFNDNFPEIKIENNILTIEGDNKQFIKGDSNGILAVIIDSEKENLNDIEISIPYQRTIAILKDKIVLKSSDDVEQSITYESINQNYDLSKVNKQNILNVLSNNNLSKIYVMLALISTVMLFISYLIKVLFDILLLSIIGYLLNKIIGTNLKYRSIFNMSVYSLTLSIILYLIYTIVNLFTGFVIQYFEIAYNAISYIYIFTALLMIQSDIMKQKMELTNIIQEQRKVKKETQEEEKKEEDKEEEQKKNEEKQKEKKKKDKNENGGTPEGSNA